MCLSGVVHPCRVGVGLCRSVGISRRVGLGQVSEMVCVVLRKCNLRVLESEQQPLVFFFFRSVDAEHLVVCRLSLHFGGLVGWTRSSSPRF